MITLVPQLQPKPFLVRKSDTTLTQALLKSARYEKIMDTLTILMYVNSPTVEASEKDQLYTNVQTLLAEGKALANEF